MGKGKVFHALLVLGFLFFLLGVSAYSADSCFDLNCKVLNPATLQEQEVFKPGDKVMLRIDLRVPQEAEGKKVSANVVFSFKVPSLGVNLKVSGLKAMGFNQDPGIEELGLEGEVPFSGEFTKSVTFEIPEDMPPCEGTVKVSVKIKKIGKKVCGAKIRVSE
ncbi:MAG: hypothetical protein DRI93_03855 [Aquificota bacterium]|nr:MAG: hypothetical protein DRI93_03855 [Aquificota bacterium]